MVSKVLGPLGTRSGAVVWSLMAVVGVVLCVVPLFDLLGYESSAAAGVAVSLLGPVIWLSDPHLGRFSPVRTPDLDHVDVLGASARSRAGVLSVPPGGQRRAFWQ